MAENKCGCGGKHQQLGDCAACHGEAIFPYWCDSCERAVPEKRCPYCGLKARKQRINGR
jgi:hypothetical protein